MTKKRINAPFYTEQKLGLQSLFNDTRLPNGWLYAGGKPPTRITAKDLPDIYLPQMVYKVNGYIRLDGIVDVVYRPNYHITHLHKDDFLYISYTTPIQSEKDSTGRIQYIILHEILNLPNYYLSHSRFEQSMYIAVI